jgi:CRP-like cAMP-binding protein
MGELVLDRDAPVYAEGAESPHLYTVLSGWLYRYKTLDDGRRQILGFAMPGDFLGLQSSVLAEMHHSIETLTPVRLCVFARDRLWAVFREHPELAFSLTWLAARSERILDEQLLSIGARTASERVAFVLLSLYKRGQQLGLSGNGALPLPITQQHLAEALGLSLVHTNRTLKRLTERKLLTWSQGHLSILDEDALGEIARVDPSEVTQRRPLI